MTDSTKTQYNPTPEMDAALKAAGASKTIYALVTPEVEAVRLAFAENRREMLASVREAWTGKQAAIDAEFRDAWLNWSKPVLTLAPEAFPYFYPTSGASEPLKQAIFDYRVKAAEKGFAPRLHLFHGEYEGALAMAQAAGVEPVFHSRKNWRETLDKIAPTDIVYLSQPSAIHGGVWDEYDAFMQALLAKQPEAKVLLDVTYVGAIARPYQIKADYANVAQVMLSLSKPFGVYYDRIGGVFSREASPALFGNMWFKNIESMRLGIDLLEKFGVFDLPRLYAPRQKAALKAVNKALGLDLKPADIFIIGARDTQAQDNDLARYVTRAAGTPDAVVRVCLTPFMARAAGTVGQPQI